MDVSKQLVYLYYFKGLMKILVLKIDIWLKVLTINSL